jgi:lysophospholipase L1-like esterase
MKSPFGDPVSLRREGVVFAMYSHKSDSRASIYFQHAVVLISYLALALLSQATAATVTYPAENAVRAGAGTVVETTNAGFHGAGYVNFPTSGGSLTFNAVDGGSGGNATISIRAALGVTTSRTGALVVNGVSRSITFSPTGAWTTWTNQLVVAALNPGTVNTIQLESNGQDLANIDEIAVTASSTLPNLTVWIAGDSTVATGGPSCPFGWGGQFDPLFDSRVTVVNSAVAGRSIRTWLYDVSDNMDSSGECILNTDSTGQPIVQAHWTAMLNGMKSGDYLFVQFGINDSSATCNRHVGLIAFQSSLGLMAQAAKARGAHPIFVTPVSAIKCSGNTAVGTRGSYVTATEQAGVTYGVPVIDLHGLSVALYNSLVFCPLPGGATDVTASTGGAVGAFFCNDHTHFDLPGAPQIAELVAKALRDQGIGLAAYLK